MFSVTAAAANELLAAAARSDAAEMALRVAARQTTDGSIEFGMGFDDEREDDEQVTFDGLKVLVGSPSRPLLVGVVLDYVEIAPGRHDFVFIPAPEPASGGCSTGQPAPRAACGGGGCGNCGG